MSKLTAKYQVSDKLTIDVEGNDQKDLFEKLSELSEVFGHTACCKCGSESLAFIVREVDGNKYYELKCKNKDCGANLSFGSHRQGSTLFPKRKDEEGSWLPDSGWTRWDREKKCRV